MCALGEGGGERTVVCRAVAAAEHWNAFTAAWAAEGCENNAVRSSVASMVMYLRVARYDQSVTSFVFLSRAYSIISLATSCLVSFF